VFSDDKDRPNRYLLAKEYANRPDTEDIEVSSFKFNILLDIITYKTIFYAYMVIK
jgi:hypothetical protein